MISCSAFKRTQSTIKDFNYLSNMPDSINEYGISKVLCVRREMIHIKHIQTEIFVKKNIVIQNYLETLNLSLFEYMAIMTNRIRHIYCFPRKYVNDCNDIVKKDRRNFFPVLDLYNGLNNVIVLDFDGVITENRFRQLYQLCHDRHKVIVCSANPTVSKEWFMKRDLPLPFKIYAMKGKVKKIRKLIEIQKVYDQVFYVDNETKYLEYAWLFGIKTYQWSNNKIKYFTMNR